MEDQSLLPKNGTVLTEEGRVLPGEGMELLSVRVQQQCSAVPLSGETFEMTPDVEPQRVRLFVFPNADRTPAIPPEGNGEKTSVEFTVALSLSANGATYTSLGRSFAKPQVRNSKADKG